MNLKELVDTLDNLGVKYVVEHTPHPGLTNSYFLIPGQQSHYWLEECALMLRYFFAYELPQCTQQDVVDALTCLGKRARGEIE